MRKFLIPIVILVIIGAGALIAIFNLDRIVKAKKDYFLATIEEKTGRQVEFEDINIAFWGGLGIRVKGVTASDDPAFAQTNFIEAQELYLKVAILPLFKKQLEVKKVTLHRPVIRILRDEEGRFNFNSIGGAGGGEGQEASAGAEQNSAASYAFFIAFANISNGEIIFNDQKTGTEYLLNRVDLSVQDIRMDEPFNAGLNAAFLSGDDSGKHNIRIESRIGPLGEHPQPTIVPLTLDVAIDPLSASAASRLHSIAALFPKDLVLNGPIRARGNAAGTIDSMMVTGTVELSDCSISFGEKFNKPGGVPCRLEAKGRVSGGTIHIEKSDVTLHKIDLTGGGDVSLRKPRAVTLNLQSEPVDLSGWEPLLPSVEPYKLKGEMKLNFAIAGPIQPGMLPGGRGRVTFAGVDFHPPQAVQPLRNIDGEAALTLGGKEIVVDSLSLFGLGGIIRASGRFDLREKPVRFAFDSKMRKIDISELLFSTPAGLKKRAEGSMNLDLLFIGQGSKWEDIKHSIDGEGNLSILQGVILDVNIIQTLFGDLGEQLGSSNLISDKLLKKYPQVFEANKTVVKSIGGLIRIEKGRLYMPRVNLGTEDYTIAGVGSIRLDRTVESSANLILSPRLSKDIIEQISLASMLADEKGQVHIPFVLSGVIPKVVVKPNLSGPLKPPPITKEVDKLKDKLLDRFFPKKKK